MKHQYFSKTNKTLTLKILWFLPLILHIIPQTSSIQNDQYTKCGVLFSCGELTGIDYPFHGDNRPDDCGLPGLKLRCQNNTTTTIHVNDVEYRVLNINPESRHLKIARHDFSQSLCPKQLKNTTLDPALFEYVYSADGYVNLTFLYGCPPALHFPGPFGFDCEVTRTAERNGYVGIGAAMPFWGSCRENVVVPMRYAAAAFVDIRGLREAVGEGFEVRFKVDGGACGECRRSGGRCGYDFAGEGFVCFCPGLSAPARTCGGGMAEAAAGNYSPVVSAVAPLASGMDALNSCLLF